MAVNVVLFTLEERRGGGKEELLSDLITEQGRDGGQFSVVIFYWRL